VKTLPMFDQLLGMRHETDGQKADLAASFVRTLVQGITDHTCDLAEHEGLKQVGLTGGVSYSGPITAWVKEQVERRRLEFVGHERIPNGDGGISTGQNAIAGALLA
jgi:hydrogenase maturation protein HypF